MGNINIGGRLHSTATGNVVAGANEIFDDTKGKKQSVVNEEIEAALNDRYTKDETYSKEQLDSLITTPNQEYVTVEDYASLPESGEADTIYRVANWDGSLATPAVDITKYSEYAWDGTGYVFLCVKSQIGEVFDISAANSGATYADLAAALDGGDNVPASIRRGGMSVKYIQTSDNNYIRYNLLATSFTTDTTQWAIDNSGVYVDTPEFLKVETDNEDKVLGGIKPDGTYFVKGDMEVDGNVVIKGVVFPVQKETIEPTSNSVIFDYASNSSAGSSLIYPVSPSKVYAIVSNESVEINYAFLKSPSALSDIQHAKSLMGANSKEFVYTPEDCNYLYIDNYTIENNIAVYEEDIDIDSIFDVNNIENKLVYSINMSHRYTMNVVIPNQYPGYNTISSFGGSQEQHIRPMAQVCFTLGTQIFNKKYNSYITGHSLYAAKKQLHRLVISLVSWHRSVKGIVDYAWGNTWQSALWAYYIGTGAILNRELFTASEWEDIVTVIEYEADIQVSETTLSKLYWMNNNGQPYGNAGDTKLEEVDWNNAVIGIALLISTNSTKLAQYRSKFIEKCCIAQSMPGDNVSGKTINGYPLSNLQGYNLRDDAVAINHNIIHPGYSLDAYCSLLGAVACMMYLDKLIPVATWFNQDKITAALVHRDFTQAEGYNPPYGTIYKAGTNSIYYPQGNDWGIVLGTTQAGADIVAEALALHPDEDWSVWGNIHMNRVLYYQNRFKTGKYYATGENSLFPDYYENETYEPTKLCIALAFLLKPVYEDDSEWYVNNN